MELIAKKFKELSTTELYEILKARAEIFIMEQNINYNDMDNVDYKSLHCFFMEEEKVVAYLRAFYHGIIFVIPFIKCVEKKHIDKHCMWNTLLYVFGPDGVLRVI